MPQVAHYNGFECVGNASSCVTIITRTHHHALQVAYVSSQGVTVTLRLFFARRYVSSQGVTSLREALQVGC